MTNAALLKYALSLNKKQRNAAKTLCHHYKADYSRVIYITRDII